MEAISRIRTAARENLDQVERRHAQMPSAYWPVVAAQEWSALLNKEPLDEIEIRRLVRTITAQRNNFDIVYASFCFEIESAVEELFGCPGSADPRK